MNTRLDLKLMFTVLLLLCTTVAFSQADSADEARDLVKQGNDMYKRKKFEQATVLFKKAIQLDDSGLRMHQEK
ncbi:MAG: hypothetical protein JRJ87_17640 [Deltaproteobacteria bacterium]|nr:hypothetical protein [Deltaproteobacteria bacterium]